MGMNCATIEKLLTMYKNDKDMIELIVDALDQRLLLLVGHIAEHIGGNILGQNAEHQQQLLLVQGFHVLGDIHLVEHHHGPAQLAVAAIFQ